MGYYLILSCPMGRTSSPNYRGVYRNEPSFPEVSFDENAISLWYRSVEYPMSSNIGISTELSFDELKYLTWAANQTANNAYEIVYLSDDAHCPHTSIYYGVDVIGIGGYSMLGDGLFANSRPHPLWYSSKVFNQYFSSQLNEYGLLSEKDAILFRNLLFEVEKLAPGCIEPENWRIIHVFKVL